MREPSDDQGGRGEQRCCVSSDAEGRTLVSFPEFSHPLSIRPVPESFFHLESFDSEHTGTVMAQVGRAETPVPPSQEPENTKWFNWLAQPSSPVSSRVAVEGNRVSLEPRVSPGISEFRPPQRAKLPPSLPAREITPGDSHQIDTRQSEDTGELLSSSDSSKILYRGNITTEVEGQKEDCAASDGRRAVSRTKHPDSSDHQPRLTEQQVYAESDGPDPEEAWRSFVFGNDDDSDAVGKAAFEEARHDATRSIQTPPSQVSHDKALQSDGNSNMATVGTFSTCCDNETSRNAESYSAIEVSGSLEATYFPSSTGTGFDVTETSNDSAHDSKIGVIAGSSTIPDNESPNDLSESDRSATFADTSTSVSHAAAASVTTSMVVATESSEPGRSVAHFRFSQPKVFVGSRSKQTQTERAVRPSLGITLNRKGRGRPRKRANDGRADIRALPNYSSDPIEDYDDEGSVRKKDRKASKSLFQKLDLV
ncbi:uncharacterized protein P884DRAFT_284588 [Thermothelomyces heterothallicus CBS 202.75]|uniref:uncharacterized protein n=1 Tax=Thermothelomyces heterothallicus CBS 202.75 TaxID=1149848 RepID=UPI003742539B